MVSIAERRRLHAALFAFAVRHRALVQAALDATAWSVALLFASIVRYDFELARVNYAGWLLAIPPAVLAQTVTGLGFGLYTGRSRFGSFDEVAGLVRATIVAALLLYGLNQVVDPHLVPRSAVVAGAFTALVFMGGTRYLWRLGRERRRRPTGENAERLLVFGAGEGGSQIITAMLSDPDSPYLPVAILDDDPANRNLRIKGVPVVGTRERIAEAAVTHRADTLLIAIPSADAELVTALTDIASEADLAVKVLPTVREMVRGHLGVGDIRSVTEADLLGRHEVQLDLAGIAGYLTGRRVLVTGAGGSIGSELCRQLHALAPAELIMVDRDESALHAVQLSIEGRALLDSHDLVLIDIRDREAVSELFARRQPEVVFHAAALKHQPLLEMYPAEAIKTNIWGTLQVLEAAAAVGVTHFVNISTDKAADPSNVLGYSKRIAERLTAYFAEEADRRFISVRFGNVLGSRGSMLGTFHAQINAGGPLTVTHPDITRFFMTVEEAVGLVIQAGAIARHPEVLVLDMGQPVSIAGVARRLADLARRPIEIVFTGLRPGEKLHEVLFGSDEKAQASEHAMISRVDVPPVDPAVVYKLEPEGPSELLIAKMAALCATAAPDEVHLSAS